MQKLVLALSTAFLALGVAACGGDGAESAGPVPSVPVETESSSASPAGPEQSALPETGSGVTLWFELWFVRGGGPKGYAAGCCGVFSTWRTAEQLGIAHDGYEDFPFGAGGTLTPQENDRAADLMEIVLRALIAGPSPDEAANSFGSNIDPDTRLLGVSIESDIATVDISSESPAGGFSYEQGQGISPHRLAQLVFTVTQFPFVRGVKFELDGRPVKVRSWEEFGLGGVLDRPATREDYEWDRF